MTDKELLEKAEVRKIIQSTLDGIAKLRRMSPLRLKEQDAYLEEIANCFTKLKKEAERV